MRTIAAPIPSCYNVSISTAQAHSLHHSSITEEKDDFSDEQQELMVRWRQCLRPLKTEDFAFVDVMSDIVYFLRPVSMTLLPKKVSMATMVMSS